MGRALSPRSVGTGLSISPQQPSSAASPPQEPREERWRLQQCLQLPTHPGEGDVW